MSDRPVADADPVIEARRIIGATGAAGVPIGILGGVAVGLHVHRSLPAELRRTYADIDLVVESGRAPEFAATLTAIGYEADRRFNALYGHKRQLWWDRANERRLDVFVGRFAMCHALDLDGRLDDPSGTLRPADLLLTKLQVVELNAKDVVDALALLDQHEVASESAGDVIGLDRITAMTGVDWGWHTTTSDTLDRLMERLTVAPKDRRSAIAERIERIRAGLAAAPKSLRWRARARVGRRVAWYEIPEEHIR